MNKTKIKVTSESYNLWWGVYGFCEKVGWEDITIYDENGEKLAKASINSKDYMQSAIEDLEEEPGEKDFVLAIKNYLSANECVFWYFYNDKEADDFYEVDYLAPRNEKGVKPRFVDIWHPDDGIDLESIKTGVESFLKKHFAMEEVDIEIESNVSIEEAYESFIEHEKMFAGDSPVEIKFSDEIVEKLSKDWNKSKDEVIQKLEKLAK